MGGITANTAGYLLYGTDCYLTANGVDVGALDGDVAIEMMTVEHYPDMLQSLLPLAGTGKIIGAGGKITASLLEWAYAVLSTLYSIGASSDANSQKIGSGPLGTITELDNVIVTGVDRNDGKAFRVTMAKARVTSPVAATLSKLKETPLEVVFEALGTPAAPGTFPMWIEIAI